MGYAFGLRATQLFSMTLGHLCLDDPETVTYYPGGTKNNASTPQTQPRTYPKGNFSKKLNALLSNYLQCVELYYSVRVKDGAKVVNAENMAVMVDEKVPVPPTERANDEALEMNSVYPVRVCDWNSVKNGGITIPKIQKIE